MGFGRRLSRLIRALGREAYNLSIGIFKAFHEESVEVLEMQLREMENAFLSLVLGGMVGLPLVPMGLAAELAPLLKDEVKIMEERHFLGPDVLADYFANLGGEW